jgi:hypothetical protein
MSLLACVQVWGHRPIEAEQEPDRCERALPIDRPEVSQVYYGALSVERPQVWFRFQGGQDQEIYFGVGVPVIDRLRGYRPRVALIGPGLEAVGSGKGALAFEIPAGLAAEIHSGRGEPRYFHEHFTGTDSWIHIEVTRRLPRSGMYYLVAYTPADPKPGDKLWLSMGTKERFQLRDLCTFSRWKKKIRGFHELR